MKNHKLNFFGAFLAAFLFSFTTNAQTVELTFVDHLKAGLIEQDVFVVKEGCKHEVARVFPEEREKYLDSEIYASAETQYHNPFNREVAGPYKKGRAIGMTLGDWLKATGTATYTCEGGWSELNASFQNLMPNATYTMWHAFMAKDNADNFIGTFDLPLGERDGSQSVFKTDAEGKAELNVKFETCLQFTDSQLMSMLAIAWHSDDKTYGISPGPFGTVTHVQLFAILPEADDVKNYDSVGQASTGKGSKE